MGLPHVALGFKSGRVDHTLGSLDGMGLLNVGFIRRAGAHYTLGSLVGVGQLNVGFIRRAGAH